MESEIIELLSIKKNNNLKVDEIASILGKDKEEVQNTLRLLGKDGIVYKNNNDGIFVNYPDIVENRY